MDCGDVTGAVLSYLQRCLCFMQGRTRSTVEAIFRAENKKSRVFNMKRKFLLLLLLLLLQLLLLLLLIILLLLLLLLLMIILLLLLLLITVLFSVDKKNQLDVTFCILYFSSNSWSTCFGQPCAHHQELTTA